MKRLVEWRTAAAWVFAGIGVVALIAAFLIALNAQRDTLKAQADTTRQVAEEGRKRRDETCRLFERQEVREVGRVIRTYAYLDNLPRSERETNLTKEIVRGLDAQREDAAATIAPSYCNERDGAPVIGLPETPKYSLALPPERDYSRLLAR